MSTNSPEANNSNCAGRDGRQTTLEDVDDNPCHSDSEWCDGPEDHVGLPCWPCYYARENGGRQL